MVALVKIYPAAFRTTSTQTATARWSSCSRVVSNAGAQGLLGFGKSITFVEVNERTRTLGAWLQARGLKKATAYVDDAQRLQYRWRSPPCCAPASSWST